jgi:hypothetical protein
VCGGEKGKWCLKRTRNGKRAKRKNGKKKNGKLSVNFFVFFYATFTFQIAPCFSVCAYV